VTTGPRSRGRYARARHAFGDWCERTLVRGVLSLGRSPWGVAGYGRARGVLHVFLLGERIMQRRHSLRVLSPDGFIRYEIAPLPRGCLPLPARPPVYPGERVIIFHFDNKAMVGVVSSVPGGADPSGRLLNVARAELTVLAALARDGALPADVRAAWGETVLAAGMTRLGFVTRRAPATVRTAFVRLFLLGLIAIYGDGRPLRQTRRLSHMYLGEIWMGLDDLQRRYPTGSP